MEKIKLIADTACDIPDEDLQTYNIDMPSVPITIDGEGYFERRSFSILEFYDMLEKAKEIPTTSRVPIDDYLDCYTRAFTEGYTHIISVTINAGGSATNASAHMAKELFFEKNPGAEIEIHIVDSRTYSIAYGYPVIEAAKMALQGSCAAEILLYLDDFFSRLEIYLGCYSLEYAKRSGRINAAAAFVGDVLGLRPIISMIDGNTKTVDKVRGEKNLVQRIFTAYTENVVDPTDPVLIVRGSLDEPVQQLETMIEQQTGQKPPNYRAGASIIINAGPKMVALAFLGKKRAK